MPFRFLAFFFVHFFFASFSLANRKRERKELALDAMESSMRLAPSKTIARPAEAAACVRRLVEDDVSL